MIDIRSFLMTEYYNLKLEYKNNYLTNESSLNLANLLLEYYNFKNQLSSLNFIKSSIQDTNNPVELLNKIKKGI